MAEVTKYSFGAGELDPDLRGRTDLEKYDMGAALMHNFIPQYGGGAFKRRGIVLMEFCASTRGRLFPFEFGDQSQDAYLILFQGSSIKILQDGQYLTGPAKAATRNGQVIIIENHGFVDDDWVLLDIQASPVWVQDATDNTFRVRQFGADSAFAPFDVTEARKIISVDHPYDPEMFFELSYEQVFDQIKFTHKSYPPYVLTRGGSGWTMAPERRTGGAPLPGSPTVLTARTFIQDIIVKDKGTNFGPASEFVLSGGGGSGFVGELITSEQSVQAVTIVNPGKGFTSTPTGSTTGPGSGAVFKIIRPPQNAGFVITVTAIYSDGTESGPMRPRVERSYIDFTVVKGEARYQWNDVEGAESYNVYRSLVYPDGKNIHIGLPLGFIGNTKATSFTDNNITPDFTKQPAVYFDPFAASPLTRVTVNNGGSGYADTAQATVVDSQGSGAIVWPIVNDGEILGLYVAHHGEGYTNLAQVDITTGSGASIDLTSGAAIGIYPSTSFTFQQRQGYAGSNREPLTIWASKINDFRNFRKPLNVTADDPYEHTLNATKQTRIRHAFPSQAGLLLFTASSIHLLRGPEGEPVTALKAVADPQSFIGVSHVMPVQFGDDILYIQALDEALRMLEITGDARRFVGRELSVLSSHFFKGKSIKNFAASASVEKLCIGTYTDGSAFGVTIHREQEVFGFGRIATQGKILDAIVLTAGLEEDFYFLVERTINEKQVVTIERMNRERSLAPEDAIYLDGVISTAKVFPEARVKLTAVSGGTQNTFIDANNPIFSPADVDKVFSAGSGRGYVQEYISPTRVRVLLTRAVKERIPETTMYPEFRPGEWWLNPVISTVRNIPYEGAVVSVMVDGKAEAPKTVVNGEIELTIPGAIVHVGFPYTARLETLPLVDPNVQLDGRKLSVIAAKMKVRRAGSYLIGHGNSLYDGTLRFNEPWNEPTTLDQPIEDIPIGDGWDNEGSITIVSEVGLPLEITQIVVAYNASDKR